MNREEAVSWESEFGKAYKVPKAVTDLVRSGFFIDSSWHNDASPSFAARINASQYVALWVEHPQPDLREMGDARFLVATYSDTHSQSLVPDFATDSVKRAIAEARWRVARGPVAEE